MSDAPPSPPGSPATSTTSSSSSSASSSTAPKGASSVSAAPSASTAAKLAPVATTPKPAPKKAAAIPGLSSGLVVAAVLTAVLATAGLVLAPDLRAAGAPAFVGVAVGAASVSLALVALVLRRKSPRKIAIAFVAALVGAIACAGAGVIAYEARTPAATADELADPALRAWSLGEAEARARTGASAGLAGVPGVLLGLLGVWLGARARREARAAAPPANLGVESPALAFAAMGGVALAAAGGVGLDARALAAPVARIDHPHVQKLRAIADAAQKGDLATACDGLEVALEPGYVPSDVLQRELSGYQELAVRCVTKRIDALPKGLACAVEAGKLGATHVAHAAGAEDRLKRACSNAF